MIRDLERESPNENNHADVCVVGAGAAGIVLAVELARLGKRVLLLEAGGATIEDASQEPYRSQVVGLMHRGVHAGRFRAHGGTTTKWGGQILELDAIDFEKREWIKESGWPFTKAELAKYYERALGLEGVSGVIREDREVWRRLGQPMPQFEHATSYLSRWCPQPNFAVLHRASLEGERIEVWLHANVVSLDIEGDVVREIVCKTLTGKSFTFTARQFVFCMGTIESSRFFLQPREQGIPWNASGLLGKHFQDHIDINAAKVTPLRPSELHAEFDNIFLDGYKYHPKIKINEAEMRDLKILNAGATLQFVSDLDDELAGLKTTAKKMLRGEVSQITPEDALHVAANLPLLVRQTWRYKSAHRAYNPASATILLRVHCEQEPASSSSVSLSDERDALGLLRTRLDWRISELERRTIVEFAKVAQKELARIANLTIDEDLERGGGESLLKCDDSNHHMGGMRMASSAAAGVVDPNLRLYGTQNCFVCSGAVFPSSGFSNPTHTLLALAVRLAEHLNVN